MKEILEYLGVVNHLEIAIRSHLGESVRKIEWNWISLFKQEMKDIRN